MRKFERHTKWVANAATLGRLSAIILMGSAFTIGCASNAEEGRADGDSVSPTASSRGSAAGDSAAPVDSGEWVALLDGTTLDQWRGYKRQTVPASWKVENSTLAFTPSADRGERGDLMTREQFGDFELIYEWRISPAGNSGVMWRVTEEHEYPWYTGPEQQVLDDARHADGKVPSHRAGALYDLVAPPDGITRPVGEFNEARILARGTRVQLYLNGQQTADVDFASQEGKRLLANSKFKSMPRFAQNARGHIVLQDHDDPVWYRGIRIREIRDSQGSR